MIGPNANRPLLGGYSVKPLHTVSVLDGIKARVGSRTTVLYSEGCQITVGGSWYIDAVVPSDPVEDRRQIAEAVHNPGDAQVPPRVGTAALGARRSAGTT